MALIAVILVTEQSGIIDCPLNHVITSRRHVFYISLFPRFASIVS